MPGRARNPIVDFIVIGTQKAATSSLFEYLRRHPQLHLPPEKETRFFYDDALFELGPEWYEREFFARVPADAVRGEVTPQYMAGYTVRGLMPAGGGAHTVPERIRATCPGVRMVAMLRDPITRFRSAHAMETMRGDETRPFAAAAAELLSQASLSETRTWSNATSSYVVRGEYARILRPWYELFPAEQLHIVFAEELGEDPAPVFAAVLRHLGVDDGFVPPNLGRRYRPGSVKRRVPVAPTTWPGAATRDTLRPAWRRLPAGLRARVHRAHRRAIYRVELWNRATGAPPEDLDAELVRRLIDHHRPDADWLADLLGRRPPWPWA